MNQILVSRKKKRTEKMKRLRKEEMSYEKIGKLFNISRQRVHQIVSGYILPWKRKKNKNKYKKINKILQSIRVRDKNCRFCNGKYNLIVHHIDGNWKNMKLSNLILLCNLCHLKLHSPFGK